MHAVSVLQKCLCNALDRMDRRRVRTLLLAVSALLAGRRLVLMELARQWPDARWVRAPLKRLDRLLSNRHLHREREALYGEMVQWLVRHERPVITVDWSPLKADEQWQLLRAGVSVGGRTMTLLEEVHPQAKLGNPKVEREFLKRLALLVPPGCRPIVVTDAGYRTPWFRSVRKLGWDYVGRLRHRTLVRLKPTQEWMSISPLYTQATRQPKRLAAAEIVKGRPWACDLVLYRRAKRGRVHHGCHGKRLRRAHSRKQARREREPWLLVTSLSSDKASCRQIVRLYQQRMQIEQSFRDLKSARFGAAFRYSLTRSAERLQVLLLIHALATFVAWLAGLSLTGNSRTAYSGMNAKRTSRHYSSLRLGFQALRQGHVTSVRGLLKSLIDPPDSVLAQMALIN